MRYHDVPFVYIPQVAGSRQAETTSFHCNIHRRPSVTDRASSSLHQQLAVTCITSHCFLNLLGDVLHRFRDIFFGTSFLLGLI
ncbi:hypothetical protein E2C01_075985 [Portunus trituberculatus]|uniref:Uncharacterized protein n=1 Tax=Portunus trituberculatus TaxID=210409 RepID=A0A5B7IC26_PORTR|nr:hypothetical protein [Portunus trituberculatus]